MSNSHQLKTGVILSYLSLFIGNLISLFYTPVMLRLMGQSEYGLYIFVSSFVGYLGLMDLGFGSTYIRFYTQFKYSKSTNDVERLNGFFLVIFSVIAFLVILCGCVMFTYSKQFFGGKLTDGELLLSRKLLIILIIQLSLSFIGKIFVMFITANERFIFLKGMGIIRNVLNPMVMFPLLLMGYRSLAMVILSLILEILYYSLCFWYSIIHLNFKASLGKIGNQFGLLVPAALHVPQRQRVEQLVQGAKKVSRGNSCGNFWCSKSIGVLF